MDIIREATHRLVDTKIIPSHRELQTMPADQVANPKGSVFAWLWEALGEARMACMDDAEAVISNCIVVPGRENIQLTLPYARIQEGGYKVFHHHQLNQTLFLVFKLKWQQEQQSLHQELGSKQKNKKVERFSEQEVVAEKYTSLVIQACANNMVFVSIERRYHTHLRNWWNSKGRARELREIKWIRSLTAIK